MKAWLIEVDDIYLRYFLTESKLIGFIAEVIIIPSEIMVCIETLFYSATITWLWATPEAVENRSSNSPYPLPLIINQSTSKPIIWSTPPCWNKQVRDHVIVQMRQL